MNEIRRQINKIFHSKKTYKNYLIINIVIVLSISIILLIKYYTNNEIEALINSEKNRIINITKTKNKSKFIDYIISNNKIEEYNINLFEENYKTDKGNFNLRTINENIDIEEKQEFIIFISKDHNFNSVTINNIEIYKVKYLDNIDDDTIYCNKSLATELYKENISATVLIKAKNYKDIDIIIKELNNIGTEASHNEGETTSIDYYSKLNKNLTIFFYIEIALIILITIYLYINVLIEEEKSIRIFDTLGYNFKQIILIFEPIFIKIIIKIITIYSFLGLLFVYIIEKIFNKDIIINFTKANIMTFIIMICINTFVIVTGILLMIKKERIHNIVN